jgi:hypothetical protein
MKKDTANKKNLLGLIIGFALSTAGFVIGGFALMDDAVAADQCTQGDSGTWFAGWKCTNGNCELMCVNNMPAHQNCLSVGSSCIMGAPCIMGPCPGK